MTSDSDPERTSRRDSGPARPTESDQLPEEAPDAANVGTASTPERRRDETDGSPPPATPPHSRRATGNEHD